MDAWAAYCSRSRSRARRSCLCGGGADDRNPPAGVLPPWHTRYKPATHKPALIDFTVGG